MLERTLPGNGGNRKKYRAMNEEGGKGWGAGNTQFTHNSREGEHLGARQDKEVDLAQLHLLCPWN